MIRLIIDGLLIFLIPFVAHAAYQMYAQKDPKAALKISKGPLVWLTTAGLVLCIGTIIISELMSPPRTGGYNRAVLKDGKLIPGEVK